MRQSPHPHDDAPDTADAFRRISRLPRGPERDELCRRVVTAWLPMADRLATQFRNRGESAEDLHQVAALGLVKAVHRYDPDRGTAFAGFAVPTVVGEIKRHFRDHMWGVHVPRRVQDLRNRVRRARNELPQSLDGRGPTVAEIAERAALTEEEVRTGLAAMDSYSTLSLDAESRGGDGRAPADSLGGPDPGLDLVVDRVAVGPRLRELPRREREILYLRFFRDMTQRQIADVMGVSQMHVSRLLSRCCARLREEVTADA
ncbi:SigB/SigF/SigG family RNA polymerase sigma factor [Streptomyces sp. NPDC053048]|uniref:SigB/SigF/SigG family RNA polymerase sigma factor n=1 Tax=Streptomyces sp. NPDC053048 TaxID=3365694 RepID=UPI0037D759D1